MVGVWKFGPFTLNVQERSIAAGGKTIPLTPKAFDTLCVLVENHGHVLSREELMRRVWPDSFVEENNLSQNISLLRKLFEHWNAADLIETVPKHGYRFVGTVSASAAPAVERIPETRYARSGDINIAFQVLGDGPVDLVFVMGWVSHLEYFWTESSFARFLRSLASFSRLILFDKRGTGLSDRVPISQLPTLEERMDDVRAVMDAAKSERAVICGVSEGGPMSALFAATYPEMTLGLVMIGSYAKRLREDGYQWGPTDEERQQFLSQIEREWGGPFGLEERAPSVAHDPVFRAWWATYLRMSASPGAALAMTVMNAQIDVRHVLPSVRVPTLVLHRTGDACLLVDEGRYIASCIPDARFVELPGRDHLPFVGDQSSVIREIEQFVTGLRHDPDLDRVLATVLSIHWTADPDPSRRTSFDTQCRRDIEWLGGRKLDGSNPLGTFDGPARAIRCACSIAAFAQKLGLECGLGLHTGECDRVGLSGLGGVAVDIAAEVARRAGPGEVLVSSTVRDLVAGSGFRFEPRGTSEGEWRLFEVQRDARRSA
jgi:DNA-binding winged helix-turn-helix (wHTH) protein